MKVICDHYNQMRGCESCVHSDPHVAENECHIHTWYCDTVKTNTICILTPEERVEEPSKDIPVIRIFETGATRDTEQGKHDYEGFLSPIVLKRFGEYMTKHRKQSDGNLRDSDNWQKGIPKDTYIKSGFRHFMDWWLEHRGFKSRDGIEDALCGVIFNAMGYLFELLKAREKKE